MSRPLARTLVTSFAVLLAPACTQDNPLFAAINGDGGTSDASTSTSTSTSEPGLTITDPDTGLEGSASNSDGQTTSSVEPGTTTATSSTTGIDPIDTSTSEPDPSTGQPSDTSTGDTSTGEPDTGEPPPPSVTVVASLATCVLLPANFNPYAGPTACELLAETEEGLTQTGVMLLDTAFEGNGGGGRQARIYFIFEIPDFLAGKLLTSATLKIHVSASADAGAAWSGQPLRVTYFDKNSLELGIPLLAGSLGVDPGPAVVGEASLWPLTLKEIVPGKLLHGALTPVDTDGILFRSSRADAELKPTLTITYQ